MRDRDDEYGNDRAEIYDRRDRRKKRDWKDQRHSEGRKRQQQRPTRDYLDDDDYETT